MSGSEIIDVAIRIYQVLGWTFLKISVVPSLFCLAAVSFFEIYVWPQYFVTKTPGSEGGQFVELLSTTSLAFFVAMPLFVLGTSYTSAVVTKLVSDFMVGNAPSPEEAEARAQLLLPKLFWLNMREVLLASGGILGSLAILVFAAHLGYTTAESDATAAVVLIVACVGFLVGGIMFLWVVTRHALGPAILMIEDLPMGEAAKRSSALLKPFGVHANGGSTVWGLYGLLIFLWVLVGGGISASLAMADVHGFVRNYSSGLPLAPILVQGIDLLPTFLVVWTLTPIWAAATTIIYYDRRIRLEGYDIEALAEDVWRADRSRRFDL